jgi:hypothetical protein
MTREEILGMEAGPKLDGMIGEFITGVMVDCYTTLPYSTDIKAAWEVVEKIFKEKWETNLYNSTDSVNYTWDCRLFKEDLYRVIAHGKTAPEAICKAALLAALKEKAEVEG